MAINELMTEQQTLRKQLTQLRESGINRFNPVRFHYIESMAKRAANQPQAVACIVEQKALNALANYQSEFAQAKKEAIERTERVASHFPDSAEYIKNLFASYDFKAVKRLENELFNNPKNSDRLLYSLASLTQQLIQDESLFNKNTTQKSFDVILRQQENQLIQSSGNKTPAANIAPITELKSISLFRKSWAKFSTDKKVYQAIKDSPENPGPLNQDMLAARSISIMQNLSPQYLSHFISYLETIFWLENAANAEEAAKTKKTGYTKKKKKSKEKTNKD